MAAQGKSFGITVDSTAVEQRLQDMIEKLKVLPVPKELTAWQREDMRRKFPNTEEYNPTAARTLIYPRSRTWRKAKGGTKRPSWIGPKPMRRGRAVRVKSDRPILRPELYERLRERMADMMERELKW